MFPLTIVTVSAVDDTRDNSVCVSAVLVVASAVRLGDHNKCFKDGSVKFKQRLILELRESDVTPDDNCFSRHKNVN